MTHHYRRHCSRVSVRWRKSCFVFCFPISHLSASVQEKGKIRPSRRPTHRKPPKPSPHAFHDAWEVRQITPLAGDCETLHGDTLAGGHVLHRLRGGGNLAWKDPADETLSTRGKQSTLRTDDLYDLFPLDHLNLSGMTDPWPVWSINSSRCRLRAVYNPHHPGHVPWIESVLHRSCTAPRNGRLGSIWSTIDSDLSINRLSRSWYIYLDDLDRDISI